MRRNSALREQQQALSELQREDALKIHRLESMTEQLERREHNAELLTEQLEQLRRQHADLSTRLATAESMAATRGDRIREVESERDQHRQRAEEKESSLSHAQLQLREAQVTLDKERRAASEKLELLERNREALKQEFENLANRIFEQKSEHFSAQTKSNMDSLLNPFREQLSDFRKRVEDVYTSETKDRQALHSQILQLKEMNRQITEEAQNLTQALKGDKKIQGNWGELILERVLERSGLRKGVEYDTQGSFRDGDNQMFRPDVVVHLPDERNLVIDSKVSLVAYQQWVIAEDDNEKQRQLRNHVEAIRQHIRGLSEKDYSELSGLRSPDFVFLFMPIEPAFVAAFQHDEQLFAEAFERKVVVVTPTTLLATLRTIDNIWRYERQSQNARKIADRAARILDKLRIFCEAMEKLGANMQTANKTYDQAMNTLTEGRGNLISQARSLQDLGVRVKKELPRAITDRAELEFDDDEDESQEGEDKT